MKTLLFIVSIIGLLLSGLTIDAAHAQPKPAGFGAGYAGGFQSSGQPSGLTVNRSRMENDAALRAGTVHQVQPQQQKAAPAAYCGCAPGDKDNFGIGCRHWDYATGNVTDYNYGNYGPWTPQCGVGPMN